jgi:hypothetical protein
MSEAQFSLVLQPETVRFGRLGPATGSIWVVFGDKSFPLIGWDDFVIGILAALVSALQRIADQASMAETVHFMGGPYQLRLQGRDAGNIKISAKAGRGALFVAVCSEEDVIEAVLKSVAPILELCRAQNHSNIDLDRLSMAHFALEAAWNRKRASPEPR